MNKPLYIFDLDGTLALTEHRQHLVQCDKPDWRAFFAACVDDLPNHPVILTMHLIADGGADVYIWSGRSEEVREETEKWVEASTLFATYTDSELRMRPAGDFTPDEILKRRWFDELTPEDRQRLVAVFDDRDKVVAMWRAAGVPCFQVAPGKF